MSGTMLRTHISVSIALLVVLSMFVACDDDKEDSTTQQSEFEWTTTWPDVWAIGRPVFLGESELLVPLRGAMDMVKIEGAGREVWHQSYPWTYTCAAPHGNGSIYMSGLLLPNSLPTLHAYSSVG